MCQLPGKFGDFYRDFTTQLVDDFLQKLCGDKQDTDNKKADYARREKEKKLLQSQDHKQLMDLARKHDQNKSDGQCKQKVRRVCGNLHKGINPYHKSGTEACFETLTSSTDMTAEERKKLRQKFQGTSLSMFATW